MATSKAARSPAVQFLFDRYIGNDPERIASYRSAKLNADVAQKIYDLRKKHGLSQADLAQLVGTQTSVISRLEDADYEGHSLSMLQRIGTALAHEVKVSFRKIKSETTKSAAKPAKKVALKQAISKKAAPKEIGVKKPRPKMQPSRESSPSRTLSDLNGDCLNIP